jgi:hypothetical protein
MATSTARTGNRSLVYPWLPRRTARPAKRRTFRPTSYITDRAFAQLQERFPDSVYPILVRAHLGETQEDWAEAARQYSLAFEKIACYSAP